MRFAELNVAKCEIVLALLEEMQESVGMTDTNPNQTNVKTSAPLDPDNANYLLKSLEHPICSITSELESSSKGESYFNAHYVLNAVQEARRKLDSIEAAAKEHQANGHC